MNVFILCTGRNGSVTFIEACQYISNYSAGHETRSKLLGSERLAYEANHIEADNRLSWFLGRLDKVYGDDAFYVHLKRDQEKVAQSYNKRWFKVTSMMKAYTQGILMNEEKGIEFCRDYVETVNENIEFFLKDKSQKMTMNLESIEEDFELFWEKIKAEGDIEAALKELTHSANATSQKSQMKSKMAFYKHKGQRLLKGLPLFLKNV